MELAGCGQKEAEEALAKHKEVWLAVDALLTKPPVAGDKYLPSKPAVDTGMDVEQKERCARGRWMQDKVNEVFSVAHSQTQTQPGAEGLGSSPKAPQSLQDLADQELVLPTLSPPDAPAQTTQPTPQSASLP